MDEQFPNTNFHVLVSEVGRSLRIWNAERLGQKALIPKVNSPEYNEYLLGVHFRKRKNIYIKKNIKSRSRTRPGTWITREVLIPNITPGSVEPSSLDGALLEFQRLRDHLQRLVSSGIISLDDAVPKVIKKRIVAAINDAVSKSINGDNFIVSGVHFSAYTVRTFLSRELDFWRSYIVGVSRTSMNLTCFEKWRPPSANSYQFFQPTQGDRYIYEVLSRDDNDPEKHQLLSLMNQGYKGQRAVAKIFHRGDMRKTYLHVSAIVKMLDITMPEKWQAFKGTITEFNAIKHALEKDRHDGIEGYVLFADSNCGGDMHKTYLQVSAVTKMCDLNMPEGWRKFEGNTIEAREVADLYLSGMPLPDATSRLRHNSTAIIDMMNSPVKSR